MTDTGNKKELEIIIGKMNCPKDFVCYKSGFKNLCKADDIGLDSLLICLEEEPTNCNFATPFGYSHFCQCPLRVYIAKKIKK